MVGNFNIALKSGDKKWLENINTPTLYIYYYKNAFEKEGEWMSFCCTV